MDDAITTSEEFEASTAFTLQPSTTYWLVLRLTAGSGYMVTWGYSSTTLDTGALSGWSIEASKNKASETADWASTTDDMAIAVLAETNPALTGVAISSAPLDGDTYKAGENIEVEFTFNTNVTYVGGAAAIRVGDTSPANYRGAEYVAGSGTPELLYRHQVRRGETDTDGISVDTNSLGSSATGKITAGGVAVTLTHAEVAEDSDHKVDGSQTGCDRVWCADVVVDQLGTANGAFYFDTGNSGSLSNRSFHLGGSYAVRELVERDTGQLEIRFYQTPQPALVNKTRLRVGTSTFKLSEGALNASENRITWTGTGLTWSDGDTVRVYLEDDILLGNFLWPAAADYTDGGAMAQKFTVGSGANGYVLREVRLPTAASTPSAVTAYIFADDSGQLGAKLRELTRPATFSTGSVATATFTAGDLVLDGGSSYWLVWERVFSLFGGGEAKLGLTEHAGTHRRGSGGWEITGVLQYEYWDGLTDLRRYDIAAVHAA